LHYASANLTDTGLVMGNAGIDPGHHTGFHHAAYIDAR
jgi:hypothetical protein